MIFRVQQRINLIMKSNSRNLEQFIQQHRQEFDSANPGEHNWIAVADALKRLQTADSLEQYVLLNKSLFDSAPAPDSVWDRIEQALDLAARPAADPLENFIREHREDFDTETPDLRVWAGVEGSIPTAKNKVFRMHWQRNLLRVAASLALLISGISIGVWYAQSKGGAQPGMAMSEVSTEYAELEQYYQRDITAKQEKLSTLVSYHDDDLNDDLLQMDNVMSELRQELANVPPGNRQQVVRAMIENYKAKAAILERVLEHVEQQQPATTNSGNHEVRKI